MIASKPMIAVSNSLVGYYIPMSVIVALVLDNQFETARFQHVKHKASSNAFSIYRSPPLQSHTHAGLRYENIAKIHIISETPKDSEEKSRESPPILPCLGEGKEKAAGLRTCGSGY